MEAIRKFFTTSDFMEHEVLRPLSHIRANWELQVDPETGRYLDEDDSFAWLFNNLIEKLVTAIPPSRYHDSEDRLGEHVRDTLNWDIRKQGNAWVNSDGRRLHPSDYLSLLEQGAFKRTGITDLLEAASGRIHAAVSRGQSHFDDMERSHQVILAGVLAAVLYHLEPHEEHMRAQAGEQVASSDAPDSASLHPGRA